MMTLDLSTTRPEAIVAALQRIVATRQPYIPSRDYVETLADELDWPSDLIQSAHQGGHLHLSGNPIVDVPVVREFMSRYEHQPKA